LQTRCPASSSGFTPAFVLLIEVSHPTEKAGSTVAASPVQRLRAAPTSIAASNEVRAEGRTLCGPAQDAVRQRLPLPSSRALPLASAIARAQTPLHRPEHAPNSRCRHRRGCPLRHPPPSRIEDVHCTPGAGHANAAFNGFTSNEATPIERAWFRPHVITRGATHEAP
jgi:hypothetical protein